MAAASAPASSSAMATQFAFHNMMRHINCVNRLTQAQWEEIFGEVTETQPYGTRFWDGFRHLMITRYRPAMRKYQHLGALKPLLAYFELPFKFSKEAAKQAKDIERNPGSGRHYPCWAWRAINQEAVWIVCINICICSSDPWFVHSSWATFSSPGSSSSASSFSGTRSFEQQPSYLTSTTVVIEELSDVMEW